MKTIGTIIQAAAMAGVVLVANFLFAPELLAQTPDSIVQLTADQNGLQLIPNEAPPLFASVYWGIGPGAFSAAPFPCLPPGDNPIYALDANAGVYLVDLTAGETNITETMLEAQATAVVGLITQVQADQTADVSPQLSGRAHPMDGGIPIPGGGGGTNSYGDDLGTNSFIDYGTSLWLEITNISGVWVNLLVSNTVADVKYEIDGETNLAQSAWYFEGFFYGSELTNWTPTTVQGFSTTNNLFLRVKSWADDGSGLPIWWQMEYFGYVGVDPYGDPKGDGWSNLQKFQNGMNPNSFYTPPAPQGVTVSYNTNGTATISWLPSPGNVTGYTVTDSEGNTFAFSTNTTSFVDTNVDGTPYDLPDDGPTISTTIDVKANYGTNGSSSVTGPVPLEQNTLSAVIVPGPQGSVRLAVSAMPANTAAISLTVVDYAAQNLDNFFGYDIPLTYTNFAITVSVFTNGICVLPNTLMPPDAGGWSVYHWFGQAMGTNGNGLSAATLLNVNYGYEADYIGSAPSEAGFFTWPVAPFYDGRTQLKQNLIFQLRAAVLDRPFQYTEILTNDLSTAAVFLTAPTNYAYAGFWFFSPYPEPGSAATSWTPSVDPFLPFEENSFDANFVFNPTNIDSNGRTTTGIGGQYSYSYYDYDGLTIQGPFAFFDTPLELPLAYQFVAPTVNGASIPSLLATNQTRWLSTYPVDSSSSYLWEIGVTNDSSATPPVNVMLSDAANWFGLRYLSAELAYGGPTTETLYAGESTVNGGYFYPETAQPQFGIVGYDYWMAPNSYSSFTNETDYPGMAGLSVTHTNPVFITSVASANFQVACYAKMAVTNAYPGVFGYLGQYFDQAYQIDTNGNVTTNTTGVLSAYGNFFATQPGPVALVTMPDIDTGERGTCTVYAVSLQLDKNHDGVMNTNYDGDDFTTTNSPYVFWVNNNYDRLAYDEDDNTNYEDDVLPEACPYTPTIFTPDCDYKDTNGFRIIPTKRDLEDFARLWVCGVTPGLRASLPTGSTVTLSWGDVGTPNTNNPTIDLFQAADADGGIGYLTNSATATAQTNSSQSAYVARLGPGTYVDLTGYQFSNYWAGEHFIWCGVAPGMGQLQLTITDGHSNILAQTSVAIQIEDIKQMYERWTVGDNITNAPTAVARIAEDDLPNPGVPGFQYAPPGNSSTPYILFVHGWNMTMFDKDWFSATAFKRLYWQGYQGRFGSFQWPTDNGFVGTLYQLFSTPSEKDNYDRSEYNAWQSGQGLLNKLTDLYAESPGHVYLLAHSMGNVVAGEALRLENTNVVVNTYVASQGAVSANTYDRTVPAYSFVYSHDGAPLSVVAKTPNIYDDWFSANGAFAGSIVNFYNTNDYALARSSWQLNQLVKPDKFVPEYGSLWDYSYNGYTNDPAPWNHFLKENDGTYAVTYLDIVDVLTNHYEAFAFAAQSYTTALGATPNVGNVTKNVDLMTVWPADPTGNNYTEHFWHSAEFRGDNTQQQNYWHELLGSDAFNLR